MSNEQTESALMSPRELASYLGYAERTINQWAAQGLLPAMKIGVTWRFRKNEVDAWLADNHTGPNYDQNSNKRPQIDVSKWEKERNEKEARIALLEACKVYIVTTIEQCTSDVRVIGMDDFYDTFGADLVEDSVKNLESKKIMQKLGFKLNTKYKDTSGARITVIERRK